MRDNLLINTDVQITETKHELIIFHKTDYVQA